jgi:hypothetical protein
VEGREGEDHARRKRAVKRGGHARKFALKEGDRLTIDDPDTLLDIDSRLRKAVKSPRLRIPEHDVTMPWSRHAIGLERGP